MGYMDEQGRLWFCGRKAHRVLTEDGPMYTICCEAIFNEHPEVFRSALVGLGTPGKQKPVLTVELYAKKPKNEERLCAELRELARANPLTLNIKTFMIFTTFPVDIRHNAKIFREKLAVQAQKRMECRQSL
ncbi:MAG: hypothetical protein D3916_17670 [Candidatus Electrothrix sp. MAN1_4]|nr:hypothetical protein [Candidatus Electrothrix sp. MAN1_4]